jgi:hypothetical protein
MACSGLTRSSALPRSSTQLEGISSESQRRSRRISASTEFPCPYVSSCSCIWGDHRNSQKTGHVSWMTPSYAVPPRILVGAALARRRPQPSRKRQHWSQLQPPHINPLQCCPPHYLLTCAHSHFLCPFVPEEHASRLVWSLVPRRQPPRVVPRGGCASHAPVLELHAYLPARALRRRIAPSYETSILLRLFD